MERKYSEGLCELNTSTRHAGKLKITLVSATCRCCWDLVHSECKCKIYLLRWRKKTLQTAPLYLSSTDRGNFCHSRWRRCIWLSVHYLWLRCQLQKVYSFTVTNRWTKVHRWLISRQYVLPYRSRLDPMRCVAVLWTPSSQQGHQSAKHSASSPRGRVWGITAGRNWDGPRLTRRNSTW